MYVHVRTYVCGHQPLVSISAHEMGTHELALGQQIVRYMIVVDRTTESRLSVRVLLSAKVHFCVLGTFT